MSTLNPFGLLGDDDAEDPSLIVAAQQKIEPKKASAVPAKQSVQNKAAAQPKLPSKPLPPAEAVREAKSEPTLGGRGGGGRGYNRGPRGNGGGYSRDFGNNAESYGNREISAGLSAPGEIDGKPSERRGVSGGPRVPFRGGGGRRGGFSNGEAGEGERDRSHRPYDRRSGTGRGNEFKREGSGRGNWGTQTDELEQVTEEAVNEDEKNLNVEKPSVEEVAANGNIEETKVEAEEKEPEDKEMTLEEYEKLLEEKRKTLLALKTEERKVDSKEFMSMQALSNKKANDDVFIKLGSEKDKKKELAEKEERAKKSVSINEFLKPAEGERYYNPGGRGRGRGRGLRGGFTGVSEMRNVRAPAIEDPGQFPMLAGK